MLFKNKYVRGFGNRFSKRTNQPATALRVGTRRQPQRYRSRLRQGWVGQPLRRVRRSKCVAGMNEFVRRLRYAFADAAAVTPHTLHGQDET